MLSGHDDCPPCPCKYGEPHCKHAHQPWGGLTDDEKDNLDFEAQTWTHAGRKEGDTRNTKCTHGSTSVLGRARRAHERVEGFRNLPSIGKSRRALRQNRRSERQE